MCKRLTLAVIIVVCCVSPARPHADCGGECYDMSGTWEDGFDYPWELVQSGSSVTGYVTLEHCLTTSWPVAGSIDPESGEFSITTTNPDPPSEENICVEYFTYNGAFDSVSTASGTWVNDYDSGPFEMTLQTGNPVLTVNSSTAVRGDSRTFTIQDLGTGAVSGWYFEASVAAVGTITRTTSTTSSTWSGVIVSSGSAHVTVTRNGVVRNLSRTVTVTPRSKSFTEVSPTSVTNGTNATLTVPDPPVPNGALGVYQVFLTYTITGASISDNGPSHGVKWISDVVDYNGGTPSTYKYVISPTLADTGSSFYLAQTGTYSSAADVTPACSSTNPATQATAGYISGSALLANTIRHEVGSAPSHYQNYVASQGDPNNNLGNFAEHQLAGPSTLLTPFVDAVNTSMLASRATIYSDTAVEPCGVSDVRLNGSCVCNGYIKY